MDFGLIALALVVAREVLNFVAKRTATKKDDKVAEYANKIPLPSLADAMKVLDKDKAPASAPVPRVRTEAGSVRDHRDQRG